MQTPAASLVKGRPLWGLALLLIMGSLALTSAANRSARSASGNNIFESLGNAFLSTINSAIDLSGETAQDAMTRANYFNSWGNSGGESSGAICQSDPSRCPYASDPDAGRNVSQIIESRGFRVEEHDVVTRDGYILSIQRIVNPLLADSGTTNSRGQFPLKPVILQHGLMASSVDWVINSDAREVRPELPRRRGRAPASLRDRLARFKASQPAAAAQQQQQQVRRAGMSSAAAATATRRVQQTTGSVLGARALAAELAAQAHDQTQREQQSAQQQQQQQRGESTNALGFYLANEGYDVFLANSRGNLYAQRHVNLSTWSPAFWSFTFDEQIKFDLPATLEYVQRLTGHTKVGYVGHSQGTAMMLGLLADSPQYADSFEPVVLLAPVAFVGQCVTPARLFAIYTPIFQHLDMWFGSSRKAVKYLAPFVCGPEIKRKDLCTNLIFLSAGFNEGQLNETRVSAYLSHMPGGTSWKNMAHWGQAVLGGRFAHFDHGSAAANRAHYGQPQAPDYDLARVRSRSLALFTADNDWLSSPADVARLKSRLRVAPYRSVNVSQFLPNWNHIDFLYGKDSGRVVNDHIVDIFLEFEQQDN